MKIKPYTIEDIYKIHKKCPRCDNINYLIESSTSTYKRYVCYFCSPSPVDGLYYFEYDYYYNNLHNLFISNKLNSFRIRYVEDKNYFISIYNRYYLGESQAIATLEFGDFRIPSEEDLNKIIDNLIFL